MKSKFSALVVAVLAILSLTLVACDNNPDDKKPSYTPPEETTLTYDQFLENAESFTDINEYLNVTGYKFDIAYNNKSAENSVKLSTNGVFDIGDYEDIRFCAYLNAQYTLPKNESSSSSGNASNGTVTAALEQAQKLEANVYYYSNDLYVDYKENNGEVQRDSIADVGDISSLLAILGVTGDDLGGNLGDGVGDLPLPSQPDLDLESMIEEFKQYLTITYIQDFGHYVLAIDYPGGDDFELDGNKVDIDKFRCDIDFYVKNDRITEIRVRYLDDIQEANASISEKKATETIEFPDDPLLYNGTFLDKVENFFHSSDVTEESFYGEWESEIVNLTVFESGVDVVFNGGEPVHCEVLMQLGTVLAFGDGESYYTLTLNSDYTAKFDDVANDIHVTLTQKSMPEGGDET